MLIIKVYEPLKWACYFSVQCQINITTPSLHRKQPTLAYAQHSQDAWTFADRVTQCGGSNWPGCAGIIYPTTIRTEKYKLWFVSLKGSQNLGCGLSFCYSQSERFHWVLSIWAAQWMSAMLCAWYPWRELGGGTFKQHVLIAGIPWHG